MDGYDVFNHLLEKAGDPTDLDACNSRDLVGIRYNCDTGEAGFNANLGCSTSEVGCVSEDPDSVCDASVRRPRL